MEIRFRMILESPNDNAAYLIRQYITRKIPDADAVVRPTHISDFQAIACSVYVLEPVWPDFFSTFQEMKEYLVESSIKILQIILGEITPPYHLMDERNGIWISSQELDNRELAFFLREIKAALIEDKWYFSPFEKSDLEEPDYEITAPDEKLYKFASRINASAERDGAPINLRVQMMEGYRVSDYVSTAFQNTLKSFPNLGGTNVLLTTLLQMNNKLELINHYSERLQHSEELDLYSLSAMNLSLVDKRDETNIAVLVSQGKLIVDVKLGG